MNLQPVTGTAFTTKCYGCGEILHLGDRAEELGKCYDMHGGFADLDDDPFKAYYCHACYNAITHQPITGLPRYDDVCKHGKLLTDYCEPCEKEDETTTGQADHGCAKPLVRGGNMGHCDHYWLIETKVSGMVTAGNARYANEPNGYVRCADCGSRTKITSEISSAIAKRTLAYAREQEIHESQAITREHGLYRLKVPRMRGRFYAHKDQAEAVLFRYLSRFCKPEQAPTCSECGYTEQDAQFHMDHYLCKNAGNAPWERHQQNIGSNSGTNRCTEPPDRRRA